jgi:hypothetical protein
MMFWQAAQQQTQQQQKLNIIREASSRGNKNQ